MANTIATSTGSQATSYPSNTLSAVAANGDVFALWLENSSNVKFSYAASPYSSWTTTTLVASIGAAPRWQAGLSHNPADDSIVVVTSVNGGNMVSYVFTHNAATHSWSASSQHAIASGVSAFNGGSVPMARDAQGRIWAAWMNNSNAILAYYSSDGATWTSSLSQATSTSAGNILVGLAYAGDYILVTYAVNSGEYDYRRIDAHAATLGSWSAGAEVTNSQIFSGDRTASLRGAPGSNYAVLVTDDGDGAVGGLNIVAQVYNASTDTWSALSTLGSNANDTRPTLVAVGSDLYALWSKYSAANNYSLVYKKWTESTQTWDTTATQLQANGSNIQWINGGATSSLLAFIWTVGTASPWSVKMDSLSLGGGGGTTQDIIGAGSAASSASLSLTVTKPLSGDGAATASASLKVTVGKPISGAGNASAAGSGSLTVTKPLAGKAPAGASGQLVLTVSKKLAGALAASGTGTLVLLVGKLVAGSGVAQANGSLVLTVAGPAHLIGQAVAAANGALRLLVGKTLAGQAAAQTTATLVLSTARTQDIHGQGQGQASGSLVLTKTDALFGSAQTQASVSLSLSVSKLLFGSAASSSAGSLHLQEPQAYQQPTGTIELLALLTALLDSLSGPSATIALLDVGPEGSVA